MRSPTPPCTSPHPSCAPRPSATPTWRASCSCGKGSWRIEHRDTERSSRAERVAVDFDVRGDLVSGGEIRMNDSNDLRDRLDLLRQRLHDDLAAVTVLRAVTQRRPELDRLLSDL